MLWFVVQSFPLSFQRSHFAIVAKLFPELTVVLFGEVSRFRISEELAELCPLVLLVDDEAFGEHGTGTVASMSIHVSFTNEDTITQPLAGASLAEFAVHDDVSLRLNETLHASGEGGLLTSLLTLSELGDLEFGVSNESHTSSGLEDA